MNRLTSRERFLLALLLGALFLLGNGLLISGVIQRYSRLQMELSSKTTELRSMKILLAESSSWSGRESWLEEHLPALENPEEAGVQLLDRVKAVARQHEVAVENPELGGIENQAVCRSVSVQFAARCSWGNLVRFLHAIQHPERFVVFENVSLQADPSSPGRMICRLKIAQWYAR